MTQLSLLAALAAKSTVLLIATFFAARFLRRASAAARHFLWTAAFLALLLLPPATFLTPVWSVPFAHASVPAIPARRAPSPASVQASPEHTNVTVHGSSTMRSFPWLSLWLFGAVLASARSIVGIARTRSLVRRSRPAPFGLRHVLDLSAQLDIRRRVAVYESSGVPIPIVCGLFRPSILLPAGAGRWPETRLRTVLVHELAHIARGDLAAQALAQAACSLYWFHPLAWIAAARLRSEREHACDDAVLSAGAQPHEYAADLVDLARGLAARRVWAGSPAMAETSNLETRVRALFDNTRNRRPLQMKAVITIGIAALALLVPLASLTVHAQGSAALGGIVIDPSGAVVPNARVTVRNQDGSAPLTAVADAAGTYRFTAIPPGKYTLEFASPGFKLLKQDLTIAAGQGVRQDANLQLGEINESITIHARNAAAAAPAGHRIRVGGNVQPARLIKQTRPEYPADLQQAGVEGTVMIRAVVSKDGSLLSPQVINTEIDSRLADLALSAIRQWRYQPSLLNGEPVEVLTTVSVDFKLN